MKPPLQRMVQVRAGGKKSLTRLGDGLTGIVTEDGGGAFSCMALTPAEVRVNSGLGPKSEVVDALCLPVQQGGDARLGAANRQTGETLSGLQELEADGAVKAVALAYQVLGDLVLSLGDELCGSRGSGSAKVGGEVGNGKVCLMTYGGNYW